jgi:hypothetical protein
MNIAEFLNLAEVFVYTSVHNDFYLKLQRIFGNS